MTVQNFLKGIAVVVLAIVLYQAAKPKPETFKPVPRRLPAPPPKIEATLAPESDEELLPGVPARRDIENLPAPSEKKPSAKKRRKKKKRRRARRAKTVASHAAPPGKTVQDLPEPPAEKKVDLAPRVDENAIERTRERLVRVQAALERYEKTFGRFDPTLHKISLLADRGLLLRSDLKDAWGNVFEIDEQFGTGSFTLFSKGPDGAERTPDDIR